jgi:uncharacterized phiE125 gp8 family phage protein
MRTTLAVTTQPAAEPVTVAQVKQHCRIDNGADDELLAGYLTAARIMAEGYLSRALVTQTLLWTVRPSADAGERRERFGSRLMRAIELPRAPVQSVSSVTVTDLWGNVTALAPAALPAAAGATLAGYVADLAFAPSLLRFGSGTLLVDGTPLRHADIDALQVAMVAGYGGPANVPATIAVAVMMTTAFLYEHRGDAGGDMPAAARALLDRDRLQFLGG